MKLVALVIAMAHAGAGEAIQAAEIAFLRHSEPVATRSLEWLQQRIEPSEVRVYEPYESREVVFSALAFDQVLDALYTPSWRGEEEILFTCSDGYQPSIPVERVESHRAWLAFDRADGSGFAIDKLESGDSKRIDLAPFYLIWENLDDALVRQEADYGWPYRVIAVDLIRTRDRFPKMTPPPDSPADVLAGFAAFRVHCSKCHKLNGEGGSIGPELNAAASPLAYRDREWLRAWIEDPSRIQPGARMPRLNPSLPDRGRTIDEILAYLDAMARSRTGDLGDER